MPGKHYCWSHWFVFFPLLKKFYCSKIYIHCCSVTPLYLILCYPMTAAHQASLTFTNSQSLLKLLPIESVMPPKHFILCHPLLLLPSIFPSNRVFSNESALYIKWPKYWSFSFSISTSNEYSWLISLGLTGFIFLKSKGLSGVFSNNIVQKHQFFNVQLSLWSNSHIHTWLLEKP